MQLRRTLRTDPTEGEGVLDPAAIATVAEESWPVVRDAEELHDALLTLVTVPAEAAWEEHISALTAAGRAATLSVNGRRLWVAAERVDTGRAVHPGGSLAPPVSQPVGARPAPDSTEACAAEILRGWLDSTGPATASELAARLALDSRLVDAGLARLEAEGTILRGRFRSPGGSGEIEWCHRRLLARIHRLTLGRLRREIEPVTSAQLVRFLARWQHLAPGSQMHGVDGAYQVIRQLQGFEAPADAWESRILPRRIARYDPELLDDLCLSGEVMWGRLSPHPAFEAESPRRVRPTRSASVTLFLREDAGWLAVPLPPNGDMSHAARETLAVIQRRGASFFGDLARATGRLPSEIEDALWELVAAGTVTADSFENLRALLDPKRRRGEGRARRARPRYAGGRWARLEPGQPLSRGEPFARQLLLRWGVVFRDLTAREPLSPPWRDVLVALRRMEARGEIRGGRFVAGYVGEQYALPEALDLLRALRRETDAPAGLEVAAADPLNVAGILLPGPRVSPLAAVTVRLA